MSPRPTPKLNATTPIEEAIDKAKTLFKTANSTTIYTWFKETGINATDQQQEELVTKLASAGIHTQKNFSNGLKKASEKGLQFPNINNTEISKRTTQAIEVIHSNARKARNGLNATTPIEEVIDKAKTLFHKNTEPTISTWLIKTAREATDQQQEELVNKIAGAGPLAQLKFSNALKKANEKGPQFPNIDDTEISQRTKQAIEVIHSNAHYARNELNERHERYTLNATTPIEEAIHNAGRMFHASNATTISTWLIKTAREATDQQQEELVNKLASAGPQAQRHFSNGLNKANEKGTQFPNINDNEILQRTTQAIEVIHSNARKALKARTAIGKPQQPFEPFAKRPRLDNEAESRNSTTVFNNEQLNARNTHATIVEPQQTFEPFAKRPRLGNNAESSNFTPIFNDEQLTQDPYPHDQQTQNQPAASIQEPPRQSRSTSPLFDDDSILGALGKWAEKEEQKLGTHTYGYNWLETSNVGAQDPDLDGYPNQPAAQEPQRQSRSTSPLLSNELFGAVREWAVQEQEKQGASVKKDSAISPDRFKEKNSGVDRRPF